MHLLKGKVNLNLVNFHRRGYSQFRYTLSKERLERGEITWWCIF